MLNDSEYYIRKYSRKICLVRSKENRENIYESINFFNSVTTEERFKVLLF